MAVNNIEMQNELRLKKDREILSRILLVKEPEAFLKVARWLSEIKAIIIRVKNEQLDYFEDIAKSKEKTDYFLRLIKVVDPEERSNWEERLRALELLYLVEERNRLLERGLKERAERNRNLEEQVRLLEQETQSKKEFEKKAQEAQQEVKCLEASLKEKEEELVKEIEKQAKAALENAKRVEGEKKEQEERFKKTLNEATSAMRGEIEKWETAANAVLDVIGSKANKGVLRGIADLTNAPGVLTDVFGGMEDELTKKEGVYDDLWQKFSLLNNQFNERNPILQHLEQRLTPAGSGLLMFNNCVDATNALDAYVRAEVTKAVQGMAAQPLLFGPGPAAPKPLSPLEAAKAIARAERRAGRC